MVEIVWVDLRDTKVNQESYFRKMKSMITSILLVLRTQISLKMFKGLKKGSRKGGRRKGKKRLELRVKYHLFTFSTTKNTVATN